MKSFESPKRTVGSLDADTASRLIVASADVALVVSSEGIIRDIAFGSEELSQEGYAKWVGRSWSDTVTIESKIKIEEMLRDAASQGVPRWRQVNHPSPRGPDVPIMYSAVQLGAGGRILALGRDMRAVAALQQRLLAVQQSMERDYWKLRHVETRYRLLFQMASEAVLIVDAASQKVLEANPAASRLLGEAEKRIVGRVFPDGFQVKGTASINRLLAAVQAAGQADEVKARTIEGDRELAVSASFFRQENSGLFLVRLATTRADSAGSESQSGARAALLAVMERAPDGFVVTDVDGRIITANQAFLDLAELASEVQARGQSLERWLGRPGVDLNVLVANLRQHGTVRLFSTNIRGEYGSSTSVEISAVSVQNTEIPCLGFTVRNVGRRLPVAGTAATAVPKSVEQLTGLVGRVPLKDIVRESTDLIERFCIEAALQLTHDNRASAAEMLGLSRQSLYVKLRRHDLGDLGSSGEDGA